MGSGYVIEHCVAAFVDRQKRELYEDYCADALYYIAQQVGVKLTKHLHELRHPEKKEEEDERPAREIVEERANKYGITVVKN